MIKNRFRKGITSDFYRVLILNTSENSNARLGAWNDDLSLCIDENDWARACTKEHSISINSRLRILQYKWLMRLYATPVQVNKYNNIPDTCIKMWIQRNFDAMHVGVSTNTTVFA